MRFLITGASGMVGQAMCRQWKNHQIVRLVRSKSRAASDAIYWNPVNEEIHLEELEGFDGVVHLAGDNIASGRWTKKKKESIFLSRVRDTWLLTHAIARLHKPPKFLFCASGVGYYGDHGDEILTEGSLQGKGFLSKVCVKWEEATKAVQNRGIRVVHGRFGSVLSRKGGLLAQLLPLFRLGLATKLGSGQQWWSWIALEDLVRAIEFTTQKSDLSGVFNFVSPTPITNAEFTKKLAASLHRPAFLKIPASCLKLIFGEKAKELFLASTRAVSQRLLEAGFTFQYPTFDRYLSSDSNF